MEGNNGNGNNIERDDWETPQWLFNKLNEQYDFQFDCCSTPINSKCSVWCDDFLNSENPELTSWINPPFSKAKEMLTHFFKVAKKGIGIYRSDNFETRIWQDIIFKNADWIFIPKGRINYEYDQGKRKISGSRFPSALFGIGIEPPQNLDGVILILN